MAIEPLKASVMYTSTRQMRCKTKKCSSRVYIVVPKSGSPNSTLPNTDCITNTREDEIMDAMLEVTGDVEKFRDITGGLSHKVTLMNFPI